MPNYAEQLAAELHLTAQNVQGAIDLIDAGNTIPFIARYRKEATGSMDDQVLRDLGDRLAYLRGLDKRKEEVAAAIDGQGAMTPELTAALQKAATLAEVEDLYRPYKPKRKTRAGIARARGLQGLADAIFRQDPALDPQTAAAAYLNDEVPDADAALAGAQDILAEQISDDAACRAELRRYYRAFGRIASAKARDEDSVYAQYYDYAEPLAKIPGHRVLALDRGEREGYLKVGIQVDAERAGAIVAWMFARLDVRPQKDRWGQRCPGRSRRAGRLPPPDPPQPRKRAARRADRRRGRGGHPRLWRQPAPAAAAAAHPRQNRHGAGPRLPHGLQGRRRRPHRQSAGYRRRLPRAGVQARGRGKAEAEGAD